MDCKRIIRFFFVIPIDPWNNLTMKHKLKHLPYLDGIRGCAAIAVVMFHMNLSKTVTFFDLKVPNAFLSVDLFFLMSGYVIARSYGNKLERGSLNTTEFMKIRLARLYPSYLFSVFLSVAMMIGIQFSQHPVRHFSTPQILVAGLCALVFLVTPWATPGTNLIGWRTLNVVWWSLFYELLVNALFGWIKAHKITYIVRWLIAVAFLTWIYLSVHFLDLGVGGKAGLINALGAASRSTYGIFLGYLLYQHRNHPLLRLVNGPPMLFLLLVLLILLMPFGGICGFLLGILSVTLLFPMSIISFSRSAPEHPLLFNILLWLGAISYPMYVIHQPIIMMSESFIPEWITRWKPWSGIALIALITICSDLTNRLVDVPGRRLLARWIVKSPSQPVPVKDTLR